jgi:aminobenzoyl-glutamate transport protein
VSKNNNAGALRLLDRIERIGNALPDPVVIFLILIAALVAASAITSALEWSAIHPLSGEVMRTQSLLSEENVARLLTDMARTLTNFPPLGLVLVVMLGAAVAERSGLFAALIGRAMEGAPAAALTPFVFLIALASHHASDAAYVVLIPLAAVAYTQAGRHPLLGVAVAYAGISGAFAGNLVPGQFDVLMLSITEAAARLIAPDYVMNPLGNWYFTAALGVGLLPIAWWVADRVVEPRLGQWHAPSDMEKLAEHSEVLSSDQKKGLRRAGLAALAMVALFAALMFWPGYSPLIDETATGAERQTPFFRALIAGFFLLFLATGWAYGAATGAFRTHRDVVKAMSGGVVVMAPYIVVAFFAAHFIAMFQWSNIGPVMAVNGAAALADTGLPAPALLGSLLGMSAVFDIVIGSASAKWSAMAPIVTPMLMLLGVSPEMTTAAYRMGDSIFNIITPAASNFVLVLALAQRWSKDFGIGSLIALMLPFSLCFGLFGFSLVISWAAFGWPVGPGAAAVWPPP